MSFVRKVSTKLHKLFIGILIISILHSAIGSSIEYPNVPDLMEDYDGSKSISFEEDVDIESLQFDSDEDIINENEYPSEQLEKIVDETMELLEYDNEVEKQKLNIKASDLRKYKQIRNIQLLSPRKGKTGRVLGGPPDDEYCPAIVQEENPKQLSDTSGKPHWILNVNNMQQTVYRRTCVNKDNSCGKERINPFGYKRVCSQEKVQVPLFSIPVDQDLVKENQVFSTYSFPSNCVCKLERIEKTQLL